MLTGASFEGPKGSDPFGQVCETITLKQNGKKICSSTRQNKNTDVSGLTFSSLAKAECPNNMPIHPLPKAGTLMSGHVVDVSATKRRMSQKHAHPPGKAGALMLGHAVQLTCLHRKAQAECPKNTSTCPQKQEGTLRAQTC